MDRLRHKIGRVRSRPSSYDPAMRRTPAMILVAAVGCAASPEMDPREGGFCPSFDAICVSDDSVLECRSREWTMVDCDEECSARGKIAAGCLVGPVVDSCLCEADPLAECQSGDSACGPDGDALYVCTASVWAETSCGDACSAAKPSRTSLGCREGECACTLEGTPCPVDGTAVCDDTSTLAICENGLWVLVDCEANCPDAGECSSWNEGTATCQCATN